MKQENYSLLLHNTFGIDVKAAVFLEYSSVEELNELIIQREISSPYLHIGSGSNLLFTQDYPGTVLHSYIRSIDIVEENEDFVTLRVGSGRDWDEFVAHCAAQGWYGAENLSDIPGEVGASAVQNIGAYGVEVKDLITQVETINIQGQKAVYQASECEYTYRDSIFKRKEMKNVIITYVWFKLSKKEQYTLGYGTIRQELEKYTSMSLENVRQAIIAIRKSKLPNPSVIGNAGSFFMNPIVSRKQFEELYERYPRMPFYEVGTDQMKIPAGWMIEQCGWKGKDMGSVGVYEKQALVLVNRGGAKGSDVVALSAAVRASVWKTFGIDIRPEVNFI